MPKSAKVSRAGPASNALAALALASLAVAATAAQPITSRAEARSLFCAHGSIGIIPTSRPPDFESEFAVAIVEIDTSKAKENLAVTALTLFDRAGKATTMKRLVKVETFGEPRRSGDGYVAYYLNTADGSRSKPWDGRLTVGKTRLRVRVALNGVPGAVVRYTLNAGPYEISGPCAIEWPT